MSQTLDESTGSKEPESNPKNGKKESSIFCMPKSGATINVYNFFLKEEKLGKYAVYSIKGIDKDGDFETQRRYSEFDKIRTILVNRWPGVHIPPLPPKNTMHNLETKFIEERRKALDKFCKTISERSYLHYSEEFQIFIRCHPGDLEKGLQAFQRIDKDDLLIKYKKNFDYFANKEINKQTYLKIDAFRLFLMKTRGSFDNLKKNSRIAVSAKRNYYEQLVNLHYMVCAPYEKNVFCEYHSNQCAKNVFSSIETMEISEKLKWAAERESLEHINNWIEQEAREIDTFLEAINQKEKYDQLRNKTQNKQKSESDDLQKVLAGKMTLKTIFSNKSKETKISDLEKNIVAVSRNIDSLNQLHDIITSLLAFEEIERFKVRLY